MKKLHYFLSLLSLLLVGVFSAQAQTTYPAWKNIYTPGDDAVAFSEIKLDGTTRYALRGIPANRWAPAEANFLADTKYTASATNAYVFEPTGEKVDGQPTYYLKNADTGKYLRYDEINADDSSEDPIEDAEDGAYVVWTLHKSQAAKMTVLQAQGDDATQKRSYCTYKQDVENPAPSWNTNSITLVFDKTNEDGELISFNCWSSPFLSSYQDTKAWDVYTVTVSKPYETLAASINQIGAREDIYAAGTTPGSYPQAVVDAYKKAFDAATALAQNEDATEEQCKAAYDALVAAKIAADAALVMPEVGKIYYLKSGRPGFAYTGSTRLLANNSYEMPTAENVTGESAKYWWVLSLAEDGKTYNIQNYYDNTYVGFRSDDNYVAFPLVKKPNETFRITPATHIPNVTGQFNIFSKSNGMQWHDSGNGDIVRWQALEAPAGGFQFIEVPADVQAAAKDLIAQDRLNNEMTALLSAATNFVSKNIDYKTSFDVTDLTQNPKGLITSASQLSSNAPEPTEGSLAGLIDGKIGTQGSSDADLSQQYFHSAWSVAESSDGRAHALAVDLGKAVQKFTLRAAMRNNNGMNDLKTFRLYTSDDSLTWNCAGTYSFNYKYTATKPEGYKDWNNWPKSKNNVGIAAVTLDKAHKYIRLEKVTDIGNVNNAFWYLSEFNVFEGVTPDEDPSKSPLYNSAVTATDRDALLEALSAANAQQPGLVYTKNEEGKYTVTASAYKATQDVYDKLYAAYNKLVKLVPDVDAFKTQLDSIKSAGLAMKTGTEIGFFPEDKKAEFDAAIGGVDASVNSSMSVEEINAARETALSALSTLKNSFIMPTQGKVYAIRCGADYAGGAAVKNNFAYSDANDTTTWIREASDSVAQADGSKAQIDITSDLRYLWLAEKVEGHKVVLRNLGTGMYLGQPDSIGNNVSIPNAVEPYEQTLEFSGRAGNLNMPVGDGFFVNFHGGGAGYGLVVWEADKTGVGDSISGSAIKFQPVDETEGTFEAINWVRPDNNVGDYQVMTLPFGGFVVNGGAYDVLGIRQDGENYTLELQPLDAVQAGVPFVYRTTEADSLAGSIAISPDAIGLNEAIAGLSTFVTSGEHKNELGTLVGVMSNTTLKNVVAGTSVFNGQKVKSLTGRESWRGYDIYGNTGYILPVTTTDQGEISIQLPHDPTTGINDAILNGNKTVDVYTISGVKVRKAAKVGSATNGLPAGVYVVGGQKVLVK